MKKTFKNLFVFAMLAMAPFAFTSCSDDDDDNTNSKAAKYDHSEVTVSVKFSQDLLEIVDYNAYLVDFDGTQVPLEPNKEVKIQTSNNKFPFQAEIHVNPVIKDGYTFEEGREYELLSSICISAAPFDTDGGRMSTASESPVKRTTTDNVERITKFITQSSTRNAVILFDQNETSTTVKIRDIAAE